MGTKLVTTDDQPALPAAVLTAQEIKARTNLVADVMKTVMKDGHHFGKIAGTPKPTLLKPGAEKLFSTFRIAISLETEDLSTQDAIRYRVKATAMHAPTSEYLGDAIGECSSDEEKYRWRRAVCKEEFEETPVDRRREPWKRNNKGEYKKIKQVRTEPADIANTVLKMAAKRAEIAVCLRVLACSDIFAQDFEDWTPEMIEALAGDEGPRQPQRKSETAQEAPVPASNPQAAQVIATVDYNRTVADNKPQTLKPAPAPPPVEDVPPPTDKDNPYAVVEGNELPWEDAPAEDDGWFTTRIDSVRELKSGVGKTGRPWTLYKVTAGEDSFTTFDSGYATKATQAAAQDRPVRVRIEQQGNNVNLVGLEFEDE